MPGSSLPPDCNDDEVLAALAKRRDGTGNWFFSCPSYEGRARICYGSPCGAGQPGAPGVVVGGFSAAW